jgi:hypothetical protein
MSDRLLICCALDRTLIPNGPQSESPGGRERFRALAARSEVSLAYVSGRHRALIEKAMANFRLPCPDFVVADVGTTVYRVGRKGEWQRQTAWEEEIAKDWGSRSHDEIKALLLELPQLRLQGHRTQNRHKLSFFVPLHADRRAMAERISVRLAEAGIRAALVWGIDDPAGVGRLDVVPKRAGKLHAVEALVQDQGFAPADTVFCGSSCDDVELLSSPIPAVLVANGHPQARQQASRLSEADGRLDGLYVAAGGFLGMNGNYAAGVLEGIAHFHPPALAWMETAGS